MAEKISLQLSEIDKRNTRLLQLIQEIGREARTKDILERKKELSDPSLIDRQTSATNTILIMPIRIRIYAFNNSCLSVIRGRG